MKVFLSRMIFSSSQFIFSRGRCRLFMLFLFVIVFSTSIIVGCASSNRVDEIPTYSPPSVTIQAVESEPNESVSSLTITSTPSPTSPPTPSPTPARASILAVGDVIMHKALYDGAETLDAQQNTAYNFSPLFEYVAPIIAQADISIANFEGTMAGEPYTGFPFFSGPDEMAEALYQAGFRYVGTANNHCIDKGIDGVVRTHTILTENNLTVVGTRPDVYTPLHRVVEVNGIRIGLLCYTFETIGNDSFHTINGNYVPEEAENLIASFNPYRKDYYEEDMSEIMTAIDLLREDGAEFIFFIVHWGNEYSTVPAKWQVELSQTLCNAGVGLIVGHHPHVLQPIETYVSEDGSHEMLVYYSLGNFLGNWAYGTNGTSGKAQDGMIARVTLVRNENGVSIEKAEYIPTFVVRTFEGSRTHHSIIPVLPALGTPETFNTTESEMTASLKRTVGIVESGFEDNIIPVIQSER